MNLPLRFLSLVACALVVVGCGERAADVSKSKPFRSGEISFEMPGNWKVASNDRGEGFHSIIVETPGDTIAVIQLLPLSEAEQSLEFYAQAFSASASEETPVGKMTGSALGPQPEVHGFERLRESVVVSLMGQEVPIWRSYAGKCFENDRLFVIFQSPESDLGKVQPGFEFILGSLLRKPSE